MGLSLSDPEAGGRRVAGIGATLLRRGLAPDAAVLDAGCGTGRYARELAWLGYRVTGLDRSPDLLAEARRAAEGSPAGPRFVLGDLLALRRPRLTTPSSVAACSMISWRMRGGTRYSAPLPARSAKGASSTLTCAIGRPPLPRGRASQRRYGRFRHRGARSTFRTVTRLDPETQRILISEEHVLAAEGGETTARYQFAMRCWTREELDARLGRAGFAAIEYAPDYAPGTDVRGDRIVVTAARGSHE